MFSARKSSDPKEGGSGVQFLNHFHKAFLRPYGKAEPLPTLAVINRRLNPQNCEWLCRPHTAISELSDSLIENITIMEESPLLNQEELQHVLPDMGSLCHHLQPFERDSNAVPSKDDANFVIRSLVDHDDTDAFMENAFILGGALFTASLNYIVGRDLLRNKEWYADNIKMSNNQYCKFQASKSLSDLRKLFLAKAENATPQASTSIGASFEEMLRELDESSDDAASSTCRQQKRHPKVKKQRKNKRVLISDSSEEDNEAASKTPKRPRVI